MAVTPARHTSGTASRAITWTWLALSAITLGSWWMAPGHSDGTAVPSVPITVLALTAASIKCSLIIQNFMEVRHAPRWLQLSTKAWLVVLFVTILIIYLI
ncbi:cytochrome C oxidase subunit IV family protein [Aldersonia sp. NBC_00410]|uniref:cytochrome C oxidase subunit IV family protein n=1 Tax=Aldersonia sp. NBC_00410 TaxID=2975954 RepID=UPI00225A9741|nr:cytochrome C oxidase subunit IV family protein [Aldersonia sp. NBC_00410]MCX5044289.1 cytochrome C oxidase subunit IV family protein [Aldersonia sp. NBC_00410]